MIIATCNAKIDIANLTEDQREVYDFVEVLAKNGVTSDTEKMVAYHLIINDVLSDSHQAIDIAKFNCAYWGEDVKTVVDYLVHQQDDINVYEGEKPFAEYSAEDWAHFADKYEHEDSEYRYIETNIGLVRVPEKFCK